MTPLTHAAFGTAIYQGFRWGPFRRWGWVAAFPAAFLSHYLLDAIPHFEGIGPFHRFRYHGAFLALIFVGLGLIGTGVGLYLMRRNREAGILWLLLSLWIGLGGILDPALRLLMALMVLAVAAYRSRQANVVGLLLAGMLGVAPDLLPDGLDDSLGLHRWLHWRVDWGTRLYLLFQPPPLPMSWRVRLTNPYFVVGYGLELLVEGIIFFGSLYLLSRYRFGVRNTSKEEEKIPEPLGLPSRN